MLGVNPKTRPRKAKALKTKVASATINVRRRVARVARKVKRIGTARAAVATREKAGWKHGEPNTKNSRKQAYARSMSDTGKTEKRIRRTNDRKYGKL